MADDAAGAVRRTPRPALLPRLAELAEQAGKLRTAEWLRTCALLPMEEWPPAPAYKGPMVPAADLDLVLWLYAEANYFRNWTLKAAELELASHGKAEDKLQARVAHLEASIGHRTTQLGERIAERQARIDAAVRWLDDPQDLTPAGQLYQIRAALQGDQPTEPRHELILKSGLSGCTGACSCGTWHGGGRHEPPSRVAYRWDAEHLTSLPLEQPTGEADRG